MLAPSLFSVSLALIAGILLIIVLSIRYRVHPFFSLSVACLLTGLLGGLGAADMLTVMKEGFGKIMGSLGFIIVLGTALGMVLQATGATQTMTNAVIRLVGQKRSVFAISLTGFIVGVPIFCDSGFIVLSGLNRSMIKKTGVASVIMSTALATGLYAVHCLIPPHPGITSAAGTVGADYGLVILYGLLVAVPTMLTGYFWALLKGKKYKNENGEGEEEQDREEIPDSYLPGTLASFMPVVIPILLIAVRAIAVNFELFQTGLWRSLLVLGDPSVALAVGLILALLIRKKWREKELHELMGHAIEKAGGILVIIGAGAAFGAVIAALKIQDYLVGMSFLNKLGLLLPFFIAAVLKTAQGSSTVAVLTTASVIIPFLPGLGLDSENGKLLAVLAMGAGSMASSHVNDSYFWVIANFSNIELKPMLRVYSIATILMALVAMLFVLLLSFVIL